MKKLFIFFFSTLVAASVCPATSARGDDFGEVVKTVERFYHVKHKGIPLLAKAGIKTATTVARLAGGSKRRIAEAGSVKVAYFEDQEFNHANVAGFRNSIQTVLAREWSPFVQVLSAKDAEQSYIYLREAGEKFNVLVVNIGQREGSVVQVTVSPKTLVMLMQDPNEMGAAITSEANVDDTEY